MARQLYRFVFVVRALAGVDFPIDMLRYDGCYPLSECDDARQIQRQDFSAGDTVTLVKSGAERTWQPTADRWRSFLWEVVWEAVEDRTLET